MTTLLTLALFIAGCVLPVPHRRMHRAGFQAEVVDGTTSLPVRGAEVISPQEDRVFAKSDSKGNFEISARYGWHGAYLVGPISYSLFPYFDIPSPRPLLRVEAPGYYSTMVQPFEEVSTDKRSGKATIRLRPE